MQKQTMTPNINIILLLWLIDIAYQTCHPMHKMVYGFKFSETNKIVEASYGEKGSFILVTF